MSIPVLRRALALSALLALAALVVTAAIPHTHSGVMGSKPHDCVYCRAQSVQPHVEAPTTVGRPVSEIVGAAVPLVVVFLSHTAAVLPDSRAPPIIA